MVRPFPVWPPLRTLLTGSVLLLGLCGCARQGEPLREDNSAVLLAHGWTGASQDPETGTAPAAFSFHNANLLSPEFPVTPNRYYRLRFTSSASAPCLVAVHFSHPAASKGLEPANSPLRVAGHPGQLLVDASSLIPGSSSPVDGELLFRAPDDASAAFLRFNAEGPEIRLSLSGPLAVSTFSAQEALASLRKAEHTLWGDLQPKLTAPTPADLTALAHTRTCLREGKTLRVLFLGDSLMLDTYNAGLDLRLQEALPSHPPLTLLAATGHGTGLAAWLHPNPQDWRTGPLDLKSAVEDTKPDLILLGGVSNQGADNLQATRDLIVGLRTRLGDRAPEFLLLTGPLHTSAGQVDPLYADQLQALASELHTGFFDFNADWRRFLAELEGSGRVRAAELRRDAIHNNDKGRLLLGRVLEAYFEALAN